MNFIESLPSDICKKIETYIMYEHPLAKIIKKHGIRSYTRIQNNGDRLSLIIINYLPRGIISNFIRQYWRYDKYGNPVRR